jgi:hypothetical protein
MENDEIIEEIELISIDENRRAGKVEVIHSLSQNEFYSSLDEVEREAGQNDNVIIRISHNELQNNEIRSDDDKIYYSSNEIKLMFKLTIFAFICLFIAVILLFLGLVETLERNEDLIKQINDLKN